MKYSDTDAGRGPCGAPAHYLKRKTLSGIKISTVATARFAFATPRIAVPTTSVNTRLYDYFVRQ